MNPEGYILQLQKEGARGAADRAVLALLSAMSVLYGKGAESRQRKESSRAVDPGLPAVSIGNITAGGTGKTPVAMWLAGFLSCRGLRPAVLSRGYRGSAEKRGAVVSDFSRIYLSAEQAGDEPYLMARSLPGVPVLTGKDRCRSAEKAKAMGADILLLDDGFQYWRMKRDLDLVLIDSTWPFGGGHLLPRGLLREPLDNLSRAGLFILTKADQAGEQAKTDIRRILTEKAPGVSVIEAWHRPAECLPFEEWQRGTRTAGASLTHVKGMKALAMSGVGNPDGFLRTAADAGLETVGQMAFPDHHAYTEDDLDRAEEAAVRQGAECIVITEKDGVKLPPRASQTGVPVYVLSIRVVFEEKGQSLLEKKLEEIL